MAFPAASFDLLRAEGHVAAPPIEPGRIVDLICLLAAVGRGDLSVGRIYEGHVNALWLIERFGDAGQRRQFAAIAERGGLFGVWNTDLPSDPLRLDDAVLSGAKNFASGIDGLSRAIVTVPTAGGRQMIVVPVDRLAVDRRWWRPVGMQASGSHIASFGQLAVEPDWMLGPPDAYIRQPWFSGGAIRFAAVQTGGAHAVLDATVSHLRQTGRDGDPYQLHRIGRIGLAVGTAYRWLDLSARAWMGAHQETDGASERLQATANAARTAVECAAMTVLEEAERGVGAAGFIAPHPLERLIRDLRTYLRQPNPDGALAAFGRAVADGDWTPGMLDGD
ncbi:acyl-CoA dehydrogenase family protein [Consotaella aegiceratis]|uniref:acyl-CoA dehydrogenase family protein n=1 Tax=Consotaella aegiceratis TaxID=3097961 RepID=UPI002F4281BD